MQRVAIIACRCMSYNVYADANAHAGDARWPSMLHVFRARIAMPRRMATCLLSGTAML